MKKLFLLVAIVAMLLPSCKKINEAIDGLDSRLDKLEQETIPSIDEQISAINTTLDNLDAMDKELKGYIDNLATTASSLQEQINATNSKIDEVRTALQGEISTAKAEVLAELEALETELKNELATIKTTIDTLKAKDTELDNKIAELRSYVDNELGKTTDWVNATFATLEQYNALVSEVATIKEQIKAINQSITNLETRLTTKINEDIANAVSTLNADIQQKVKDITDAYTDAIKSAKEEITSAYTTAIQTAITTLDNSLKTWVGEQLSNYYTIAESEAKLAVLKADLEAQLAVHKTYCESLVTALTNNMSTQVENLQKQIDAINKTIADNATEIANLKTSLATIKQEITEAYTKAISDAISSNNGIIDGKIAGEVATVNTRIDNEVTAINNAISALTARVATLEDEVAAIKQQIADILEDISNMKEDIANLLSRIQSISYIPQYDDGKATVKYNGSTSRVTLDFEVSPKDAVVELTKVWQSAVSVKAIYTQTRAVSFIDMPIVQFEADATNGVISVTASGENLSAEFFNGTQTASVRLSISDGNNSVVSEYAHMTAKKVAREEIENIPNNEIWYTSTTGTIIQPYRAYAFDANIVSNIYKDGQGVIIFDAPITSIGEDAFYGCSSLTSITIPDSVTSIGEDAFFACNGLTSVNVSDLSAWCQIDFSNRESNPLENRAKLCLNNIEIADLIIPSDIVEIKMYTFTGCSSLTSVVIPDSVTKVGANVFQDCRNLISVTIPDSLTSIENSVFSGCSSLQSFYGKYTSADNRCLVINNVLKAFAPAGLTEYTIPDSVTSIEKYAFENCGSLTSVTIPDSVTSIKKGAFSRCSSLTSVIIGNSVTSIGTNVFQYCSMLISISIPDSVTEIGNRAFYYCESLTSVMIGNSVTSIGIEAFEWCTSLASVTIGNSVTSIGNYAFYNCKKLTSITIPDGVTSIGECAFWYCDSLTRVYCMPTTPPTGGWSMFNNNASGREIYVPTASIEAYKSASYWSEYASSIEGYDFE